MATKKVLQGIVAQNAARTRQGAETLAKAINKKHGEGTVVRASDAVNLTNRPRITSGSTAFDAALGGGWPCNQWTEIVGRESHGKTAVVMKTLASNQAVDPDFTCVWVAAEEYDRERAATLGIDNSRVFLVEENVMEIAYELILEYLEDRSVDMAVIDSYPSLIPNAEDDVEVGGFAVGAGARLTNQFMRKATKATKRSLIEYDRPVTGFFINQWRSKVGVMFGDPRTTPGGEGKNYWAHVRAEVRREEWISDAEKKNEVGITINLNLFKNKIYRPRTTGSTDFYFTDYGDFRHGDYDEAKALLAHGQLTGHVEKSGGGYRYNDAFFRGAPAFRQAMREQPELAVQLRNQILTTVNPSYVPLVPNEIAARRRRARGA